MCKNIGTSPQIFGTMLATFERGTRNYQRENTLVPKKIWH